MAATRDRLIHDRFRVKSQTVRHGGIDKTPALPGETARLLA
jgi:uncharacterized protein with HEPN domain